jgi:preprotein translocase subunit SecG
MNALFGILTFLLILVSLFLVLVVLMQKAKSDGGMGSAMGGGMAEATFGADTSNVLSKATINAAIALFLLSFVLYLGRIYQHRHIGRSEGGLPTIAVPISPPMPAPGLPQPMLPPTAAPGATPAPPPANGAK